MPFKTELVIKHVRGTVLYSLTKPLVYETWKGVEYTMPIGFVFDGHSYPKLLRGIVGSPFASKTVEASCVHDFLLKHFVDTGAMTRREGDGTYSEAQHDCLDKRSLGDVLARKRNYVGVRIGGLFRWLTTPFRNLSSGKPDK